MNVLKILSRVQWRALLSLLGLGLAHLRFIRPTYTATKACMALSTHYFGRKHYQNGPANAFRHALWNILIAKNCLQKEANKGTVLRWTKKITDWHETAFFGKTLPMNMDYHNNAVGRQLFLEHPHWSREQFLEPLLRLTERALKMDKETDLDQIKNQLVYITDDH